MCARRSRSTKRRGSLTGVSDTLRELGHYLEKAGDLRGAVEAYHQHRALADELLRATSRRRSWRCRSSTTPTAAAARLALLQPRERDQGRAAAPRATCSSGCGGCWRRRSCCRSRWSRCCYRRVRQTNRQLADQQRAAQGAGRARPADRAGEPAPLPGGDAPAGRRRQARRHRVPGRHRPLQAHQRPATATPPATRCWSRWRGACARRCASRT